MRFAKHPLLHGALALVTCVTTMVAATPHFECTCPSGKLKPYCLGISLGGSSCCAAATRTESSRPAKSHPKCSHCAKRHAGANSHSPQSGHDLKSPNCHKSLRTSQYVSGQDRTNGGDHSQLTATIALTPLMPVAAVSQPPVRSWFNQNQPPPTDLIIALLHFLI